MPIGTKWSICEQPLKTDHQHIKKPRQHFLNRDEAGATRRFQMEKKTKVITDPLGKVKGLGHQ